VGLGSSPPPQFGQAPPSLPAAHSAQKVHSNEQMNAPFAEGCR
jgi:hypothetical protein